MTVFILNAIQAYHARTATGGTRQVVHPLCHLDDATAMIEAHDAAKLAAKIRAHGEMLTRRHPAGLAPSFAITLRVYDKRRKLGRPGTMPRWSRTWRGTQLICAACGAFMRAEAPLGDRKVMADE
jgi:hypothetical protein